MISVVLVWLASLPYTHWVSVAIVLVFFYVPHNLKLLNVQGLSLMLVGTLWELR